MRESGKPLRLLLVVPSPTGRSFWGSFLRMIPNNSLLQVARLTPKEVEIELVDENHSRIRWDRDYDLVGITCMTCQARRAYEIADEFRRRGVKVVIGGFHATFQNDECSLHADSVVIGEAEGAWEKLIADFQGGKLEKYYQAETPSDLKGLPPPRYDLVGLRSYLLFHNYVYLPVSATRGCPYHCDFCSIQRFYRAGFRARPVEEVIQDIKTSGIKKSFFLADDNFIADRQYARELLEKIIPLKIEWIGQCDITIAEDPEFLALARRSGLCMIYTGLETINSENLKGFRKLHPRVEKYPEYLRNLRQTGIACLASIMFGFDHDDAQVFERTVDFLIKNRVEGYLAYILNPFPGSDFCYRLGQENRYLETDLLNWDLYDGTHALFKPRLMSARELEKGFWSSYQKFYSLSSIFRRIFWPPNFSLNPERSLIYSFRMMTWAWLANVITWVSLKITGLHPFTRY